MSEENKIRYSAVVGHDGKAYIGVNLEDSNLEDSNSEPDFVKGWWTDSNNKEITKAEIGNKVRFHINTSNLDDDTVLNLKLKDWDEWINPDDTLNGIPETINIDDNKGYIEFTILKDWKSKIKSDVGSEIELYFIIEYGGETYELPKSTNDYLKVYYYIKNFHFNGNKLFFRKKMDGKSEALWSVPAVSGIGEYMNKKEYTNRENEGPIPEGTYYIKLVERVPTEKTGGGWGRYAWRLNPKFGTKVGLKLTSGRGGFFLHEDGNEETNPGTAGCIGCTKSSNGILKVREALNDYQKNGNDEIILTVDYDVVVNETVKYHEIKSGESLSSIAQNNNMTLNELLQLNPDITTPHLVYPKQRIRIQ